MENKTKKKKKTVVAVSGGFDPIHIGHIRLFEKAKRLGDKLVVVVNNDNWLKKKKRFVFMPEKERVELIHSIKWVDAVLLTAHKSDSRDMSVTRELEKLKPDIFANGGDRNPGNVPEEAVCKKYNIRMVFDVGRGGKVQSSSWLLNRYISGINSLYNRKIKSVMENKTTQLRFRKTDRNIFEAIKKNRKKVETRAAFPRFINIKPGDDVRLVCGKDSFKRKVKNARVFKTISAVLKKYKVEEINPSARSKKELEDMYDSFPDYRAKIKKYGLIVLEL